MKPSQHRHLSYLVAIVLVLQNGCLGRPSFEQATKRLNQLLDPAVRASFAGVKTLPEPTTLPQTCSDPLIGPADGARPTISYETTLSALELEPLEFLTAVANAWKEVGAVVEVDDEDDILSRNAVLDEYTGLAVVNLSNQEVYLGDSGPCVDNPET